MQQKNERPDDIVGHKTIWDEAAVQCRHEPLRRDEADAILAHADAAKAKREADMPDERSAIEAMWSAFQRLRELGWREAMYCPKDGSNFLVIEAGSTGIHPAFYSGEWPTGHTMTGEGEWCGPGHPILFKLTPDAQVAYDERVASVRARFRAEREAEVSAHAE